MRAAVPVALIFTDTSMNASRVIAFAMAIMCSTAMRGEQHASMVRKYRSLPCAYAHVNVCVCYEPCAIRALSSLRLECARHTCPTHTSEHMHTHVCT
eukprot:scaffold133906_cov49-Tisochrysis_lutea.AAC.4